MARRAPCPGHGDWRARVTAGLFGVAGGVSINVVSDNVGYQAACVAGLGGVVLTGSRWLRSLPSQAPLVRWTTKVVLGAAMLAATVEGAVPSLGPWWSHMAAATGVLLAAAIMLFVEDYRRAMGMLVAATGVQVGIASIYSASYMLITVDPSTDIAYSRASGGVMFIAAAALVLVRGEMRPVAGLTFIGLAYVCGLLYSVSGIAITALSGLLLASSGSFLVGRALSRVEGACMGLAMVGSGVNGLYMTADLAAGVTVIALGAMLIGTMLSARRSAASVATRSVVAVAYICFGVAYGSSTHDPTTALIFAGFGTLIILLVISELVEDGTIGGLLQLWVSAPAAEESLLNRPGQVS